MQNNIGIGNRVLVREAVKAARHPVPRMLKSVVPELTTRLSMDDAPFIIRGLTGKGSRFRPSDWADRLACVFSVIDPNNRMNYSPYVQPTTLEGIRCVVVNKKLKAADPGAYRFLQAFAESNELLTENGD